MSDRHAGHRAALSIADARRRGIEREIESLVTQARQDGVPWSEIGAALGVTKQAAQQKYGTGHRGPTR